MKQYKLSLGLIGISILLFSFSNCGNAKMSDTQSAYVENPPFTLGDVFYQDWVAGTKEGGSGTHVHISFTGFTEDVVVRDIYFRDKMVNAQNSPQYRNQYIGYFINNQDQDIIMNADVIKESQNIPPKKSPFTLNDSEAVISYLHKGAIKYYKISNMRQKPMLAYPQSNPKDEN